MRPSTRSPPGSGPRWSSHGRTRSWCTSGGRARTASPSGCWPAGGWTGTTRTPTSALAAAATGFQFWMGIDRPSPDHANAKVIYLISAHLESGHYFNPHAQRIIQARENGAKVIVLDTRLSNTATHADYWLPTQPGSEAAVNLAIASHLITDRPLRPGVRAALVELGGVPRPPATRRCRPPSRLRGVLAGLYAEFTFEFAAAESGIPAQHAGRGRGRGRRARGTSSRATAGVSAAAGNLGGWQVSRYAVPHLRAARRGRYPGRHVPERVEQVRARGPSTCRRTPACGRSCPGRWSTRWRRTRCRSSSRIS